MENEKLKLWNLKGEAPKVFWKKHRKYDKRNRLSFSNNQLFQYADDSEQNINSVMNDVNSQANPDNTEEENVSN